MKKYAVDVLWAYGRSYELEAESREEAVRKVEEMVGANGFDPLENGFERLDDFSAVCSGEENSNGEIVYSTKPWKIAWAGKNER